MPDENALIDLALDADGDLDLAANDVVMTSGLAAVAQNIDIIISTFRGEWFLDEDSGVPYFQDILGHKYDEKKVLKAFREQILKVRNVLRLAILTAEFNRATRELTINYTAISAFGEIEGSTEIA